MSDLSDQVFKHMMPNLLPLKGLIDADIEAIRMENHAVCKGCLQAGLYIAQRQYTRIVMVALQGNPEVESDMWAYFAAAAQDIENRLRDVLAEDNVRITAPRSDLP